MERTREQIFTGNAAGDGRRRALDSWPPQPAKEIEWTCVRSSHVYLHRFLTLCSAKRGVALKILRRQSTVNQAHVHTNDVLNAPSTGAQG